MSDKVVVRAQTAVEFLPKGMPPEISLKDLAEKAKRALRDSKRALGKATAIADGSWWTRLIASGDLQKYVLASIRHIRDISEVNIALSAICNDLAAKNLEEAKKFDSNQIKIEKRLADAHAVADEILKHLHQTRESRSLVTRLPLWNPARPMEQAGIQQWLEELSAAIDLQYGQVCSNLADLAERLEQHVDKQVESNVAIKSQLQTATTSLGKRLASLAQRTDLLSTRSDEVSAAIDKQFRSVDLRLDQNLASVRAQSEDIAQRLASTRADIAKLDSTSARAFSTISAAVEAERASREAMEVLFASKLQRQEELFNAEMIRMVAVHRKEIIWAVSGVVTLLLLGFGYLAHRIGLW